MSERTWASKLELSVTGREDGRTFIEVKLVTNITGGGIADERHETQLMQAIMNSPNAAARVAAAFIDGFPAIMHHLGRPDEAPNHPTT